MKCRPIIGVVTGNAGEYCNKQIIKGICQAGLRLGYDVVILSNIYNPLESTSETNCENRIYELLLSKDMDGLIVIPESLVDRQVRAEIADRLSNVSVPVVIVGEETPEFYEKKYPIIQNNESADIELLTNHLIDEHGFQRIDLLTGSEGVKATKNRTDGFLAAIREHGIPESFCTIHTGDYWYSSGERLANQYSTGDLPLPEAVVCASDLMAYGLLKGLKKNGISVPEQIAVVSYEYSDRRVYTRPLLTCLERNRIGIGAYGMQMLHSIISGQKIAEQPSLIGNMVYGESCGCMPDAGFLDTEYEEAIHIREMNDWNPLASLERRLISCQNMKSFIDTLADFQWLIPGIENMYLRLFTEWYDAEASETEAMYLQSIITWKNALESQTTYYNISDITSASEAPSVWYLTTLFIEDRLFGNYLLQYNTPDCYDWMFRNWMKSVSACLEHLRMKNDIRYLLRVQDLSEDKDSFTGMHNEKGIRKAFLHLQQENPEHLYCILIQTCLYHDTIFDEERKKKNKAISSAAEIVSEFSKRFGTAAHLGNGKFLCFVHYSAGDTLLTQVLQAFFMQCGSYAKNFGTDSFVFSAVCCMDSSFEAAIKQAETVLSEQLADHREKEAFVHYRKMLRIRNYIYSNPSETFLDETLCERLNENLTLVRAAYSNCFSTPLHTDCIRARISYSLYQILTTSASGNRIADQCGYNDSKYFLRQFSAANGMSISEFRAKHRMMH